MTRNLVSARFSTTLHDRRANFNEKKPIEKFTCDAREKFGPGERFLLGAGGALLPGPDVLPFRFLLLLAGR